MATPPKMKPYSVTARESARSVAILLKTASSAPSRPATTPTAMPYALKPRRDRSPSVATNTHPATLNITAPTLFATMRSRKSTRPSRQPKTGEV